MTRSPESPWTLDGLRAVKDDEALIAAAHQYLSLGEKKMHEARGLRNAAVRRLVEKHGPAETARRTGIKLATVKAIRGGA